MKNPCACCGKPTTSVTFMCHQCRRERGMVKDYLIPCEGGCGRERRRGDIESGARCRKCLRIAKAKRDAEEAKRAAEEAELDAAIDWAAIEWVCQGYAAKLNTEERRLAIRRMSDRLVSAGDDNNHIPPGKVTAEQLGVRMGYHDGTSVTAVRLRLPAATKHRCPECRGDMWVLAADGTVEQHGNGFLNRCSMSGEPFARELVSA